MDRRDALRGSSLAMRELTPMNLDRDVDEPPEPDELLSEVLSTLALVGAVLLLVLVISLFGRL
jgi:hypothetical protein